MSSYAPPTENLPHFNFASGNSFFVVKTEGQNRKYVNVMLSVIVFEPGAGAVGFNTISYSLNDGLTLRQKHN